MVSLKLSENYEIILVFAEFCNAGEEIVSFTHPSHSIVKVKGGSSRKNRLPP